MRKIDGVEVLEDGESVRVSMATMDSTQRAVARGPARDAYEDAVQRLGDAWRGGDNKKPMDDGGSAAIPDPRIAAHDAYVAGLGSAWRMR